ncbi:hypothetical protein [Morganella morganii]|uniref:hypothetical protein n=1 Tax=Morganella morganii TaxID=582 RepID=UPI00339D2D40
MENRDSAVLRGFVKALELASNNQAGILVWVPMIQNISSGHLSSALGKDFADKLKKPAPFEINGINISRTSKIPRSVPPNTVVWMLWPSLRDAEAITKAYYGQADIVATEWVPFDELNRWKRDNKAKVI